MKITNVSLAVGVSVQVPKKGSLRATLKASDGFSFKLEGALLRISKEGWGGVYVLVPISCCKGIVCSEDAPAKPAPKPAPAPPARPQNDAPVKKRAK